MHVSNISYYQTMVQQVICILEFGTEKWIEIKQHARQVHDSQLYLLSAHLIELLFVLI